MTRKQKEMSNDVHFESLDFWLEKVRQSSSFRGRQHFENKISLVVWVTVNLAKWRRR